MSDNYQPPAGELLAQLSCVDQSATPSSSLDGMLRELREAAVFVHIRTVTTDEPDAEWRARAQKAHARLAAAEQSLRSAFDALQRERDAQSERIASLTAAVTEYLAWDGSTSNYDAFKARDARNKLLAFTKEHAND